MKIGKAGVLWMLCGVCFWAIAGNAQDKIVEAPHPVLVELEARLKPVILEAQPDAVVKMDGYQLVVHAKTGKFSVDALRKLPMPSSPAVPLLAPRPDARAIEGPLNEGILLELSIRRDKSLERTLSTPSDIQRLSWITHYNRYNLRILSLEETATQPHVTTSTEKAEFVDTQRYRWMYEAINALSRSNIVEVNHDGTWRGFRAMTRYEFSVAIARLIHRRTDEIYLFEFGEIVRPGTKPRDFQIPSVVTGQILNDIMPALAREFRDELELLGVRIDPPERRITGHQTSVPAHVETDTHKYEYIWMSLSHGTKADAKLIEQIKQTVAAFAAEKAALQKPADTKKEN